jgi:hypothetical protein
MQNQNAAYGDQKPKKGPVSTDAVFVPFLLAIHFLRTSIKAVSLATLASVPHFMKLFPNDAWLHWSLLFSYVLRIHAVT